jgi:isopenicillin N synthase-like dioxygenase
MTIQTVSFAARGEDQVRFAASLGASFERYGFAVICDHGLSSELVDRALAQTKAFFALPSEVKWRYVIPGGAGQRGYTPFGLETATGARAHDLKEFWHVGRELAPDHPYRAAMPKNLWPAEIDGFQSALSGLYQALDHLGGQVLSAIARHLGLGPDAFDEAVRDGNSVLRLLHYPPLAPGARSLRAQAHEDINAITLLLGAEEAGLELLDRDGRWMAVDPPPGAIVCNIGDMLQRLTNRVLPSTTHRVVNPAPDRCHLSRYSLPFFLHFAPTFRLETLASCVSAPGENLFPVVITADEYLQQRLREIKLA